MSKVYTVVLHVTSFDEETQRIDGMCKILGCFEKKERAIQVAHEEASLMAKHSQLPINIHNEECLEIQSENAKCTFFIEELQIDKKYTEKANQSNLNEVNIINTINLN